MPEQRETRVTNAIRLAVLKAYPGAVLWKIHGGAMQRAGIPDLIGCIHGHFIAIEVKHPDAKRGLTRLQESTLEAIQRAGGLAYGPVVDPEEALYLLAEDLGSYTGP